ncbi:MULTISPECIES: biotin transporter BioY [Rhodomicrobium]|uniref:biotin transporter BioY n=1 Tax=Rhodomicrobium TaxID=1068 RepID=UPI000B4B8594|nr:MULTISPECIES: biotin transporter BioY [Rhodomicrobium]
MRIQDVAFIALFAAVTALLGLVPRIDLAFIPVPITAQSLGPMLAGSIIGARRGALSQVLFLLLVAAGLPLLAGGRGGLGVFVGPSAGFLIGFPFTALAIGLLTERFWAGLNFWKSLAIHLFGGIVVIHAFGIPVFAYVGGLSLIDATIATAVFAPGGVVKSLIAAWVTMFVKRGYPVIAPGASPAEQP